MVSCSPSLVLRTLCRLVRERSFFFFLFLFFVLQPIRRLEPDVVWCVRDLHPPAAGRRDRKDREKEETHLDWSPIMLNRSRLLLSLTLATLFFYFFFSPLLFLSLSTHVVHKNPSGETGGGVRRVVCALSLSLKISLKLKRQKEDFQAGSVLTRLMHTYIHEYCIDFLFGFFPSFENFFFFFYFLYRCLFCGV